MNFNELANIVACAFQQTMKEEGFETFAEMKKCYMWTPEDIKEEVDDIIRDATFEDAYIDELDGTLVFCSGQDMEYKRFQKLWNKALKSMPKD